MAEGRKAVNFTARYKFPLKLTHAVVMVYSVCNLREENEHFMWLRGHLKFCLFPNFGNNPYATPISPAFEVTIYNCCSAGLISDTNKAKSM